jgi:hypothetical protein
LNKERPAPSGVDPLAVEASVKVKIRLLRTHWHFATSPVTKSMFVEDDMPPAYRGDELRIVLYRLAHKGGHSVLVGLRIVSVH